MAAEAVVAEAIIGISNLLIQEVQFIGAVSGKVEQLQTEMKRIQRFLKDADKRQDESEGVRGWVSEIRELAYDAEDVVANFIAEAALRKEKGLLRQLKRYATIFVEKAHLHQVGVEIDAIIAKIANLRSSLETYGIKINDQGEGSSSHTLNQLRRAYSFSIEDETVGLVDDIKVLLEQLIGDDHKHRKVISICGMGGLGKTTLAKKLYHHDEVKRHFAALAWISVSQTFKTREILESTLIKLTSASTDQKEEISKMKDDEVAKKLFQVQQEKRCLVILDDIWYKDDWNVLKHAFPIEKMDGIIVLTTRSKPLGQHVHRSCFIHESQSLSEEDSWELFQKKAFLGRDYQDITNMEILGREMVKKCSGLPLAIIALGGILATKFSLDEWNLAHKNVGMYLRKGGNSEYSNIEAILALSYSELPYHLKPCLLHLSQFPEDCSIPTKMLFQLWMAEGIVANPLNGEETLEDVADGYLRELIDRCLVLKGRMGSSGRIKSCRLHDLIRDLSLSKANQENYLEIIDVATKLSKAHRVVVHTTTSNVIHFEKKSSVRSLLGTCDLKSLIICDFHMLRVLSLKDCVTPRKWINEIGKLIHLKYLSLDNCGIEYLPSSLGNLRYLQTFFFKTNRQQRKLMIAKGMWNFQELNHLEIECSGLIKDECNDFDLGKLIKLRTLRTSGQINAQGLEKLTNLQKLTTNLKRKDLLKFVQSEHLNGLATLQIDFYSCEIYESELRKLLIGCGQAKKLKLFGKIEKLPEYHQNFPPNLTKLKLEYSELNEDPMPVLEKLSKLAFLHLDAAFDGEKIVCSSKGFPRLKTLFLYSLDKLVEWQVDEGAMASLCHLRIQRCWELKMVPEGIKYINTLSQLDLHDMRDEFCDRVKVIDGEGYKVRHVPRIGEDYYKVRHVPRITFYANGLKKSPNLEKLKIHQKDMLKLVQSENLNRLVTLKIEESLWGKFTCTCESELRKLLLGCGQLKKLVLSGRIEKLPEYHKNFTPNLTKLKLKNSDLYEDPMPVLEKLPKINYLFLGCAFFGEKIVCSAKGFPVLKTLILDDLENLVEWQVDEGAMVHLCHLSIENCKKLKMVPEGIKYISTLSQLEICAMPNQFNKRVKVIFGSLVTITSKY